jgi:hypothetical protein
VIYVRYLHLTKAKHIRNRKPHNFVREGLHKDYDGKGCCKEISGREPQGTLRQDELIGGKPPVVK